MLCALLLAGLSAAPAHAQGSIDLELDAPPVLVRGVERELSVGLTPSLAAATRAIEVRLHVEEGRAPLLVRRAFEAGAPERLEVPLVVPAAVPMGAARLVLVVEGAGGSVLARAERAPRVLPPLLTFVPPLLAIALALWLRQVIPALVAGVLAGSFLREGFDPGLALVRMLDHDLVEALAESGDPSKGHLKIVLFTLLLGGMVGVVSRSGGAAGLVRGAARWARTRQSAQATGWFAGLLIFFDDYANTLVVGPSIRPLSDRLRVSREKLAFVVDATAAPIASVALVSTWVGYEVSLIGDALARTALAGQDPYAVFLASLPYRFYAWLMLGFVLLVALSGRDFGPMRRAEERAARTGEVLRPGSQPLSRTELFDDNEAAPFGASVLLGLAPIVSVTLVTFVSLWVTGRLALRAAGEALGTAPLGEVLFSLRALGLVLGEGSSYDALLFGAASGVLVALLAALALRRLDLSDAMRALTEGIAAMSLAVVILTLAWMIGGICGELGTAEAAVGLVGEGLPTRLLPAVIFLVAAAIAFSTGSSWTTMAVLVPVALPLADRLAGLAALAPADHERILFAVTGAVLTGAVFGDHCSPLSDTTVMSSLSAGCDHVDHVRTQLPYALLAGGVSLLTGDLAVGFGLSPWLGLAIGLALLAGLLFLLGRRTPEPGPEDEESPPEGGPDEATSRERDPIPLSR